jgi:fimbrial chaperone protein
MRLDLVLPSPDPARRRAPARWPATAALAALFLGSGTAPAQVLVNPVVVEVGAQQRVASVTITLSDKAAAPIRLQAEVLRWEQDLHGGDLTHASNDLLVSPPIADIQPGQKQLFRIALRGPRPAPGELAYRLVFEDIAPPQPAAANGQGLKIKLRMRYDLPVMIAPAGPVLNLLRWQSCAGASPADACVRLRNDGNRRVKVRTLTLAGDGWRQALDLKEGENVLAGASREWHVALPAGHAGPVTGVQVATARGETLQAEASHD